MSSDSFVANSPSIFVFLNLLPVHHWEMRMRHVVKPQENEKQGKSLRRGINSRTSLFLRARAVPSSLGCDEPCWKDEWSVLRIFQRQDSYSLLLYAAPAVDDSLSKATNTKNHILQFVQHILIDDRFGVLDGEEKNASLAESLLAEPCLMVFWPCNTCWRLDGSRESAVQSGRAVSEGRAETRGNTPGCSPAGTTHALPSHKEITHSLCEWGGVCLSDRDPPWRCLSFNAWNWRQRDSALLWKHKNSQMCWALPWSLLFAVAPWS